MKKLMIAAAAAAIVGGASATVCQDSEIVVSDNPICDDAQITTETEMCRVWDFAMSVKTLAPKKLTCKTCTTGDCQEKYTVTYLDAVTRKFVGYAWTCAEECVEGYEEGEGALYVTLWEKSKKAPLLPLYYTWADEDSRVATQDPASFAKFNLIRYGKKATSVAAYWELLSQDDDVNICPFELYAAGIGGSGDKTLVDDCDDIIEDAYALLLKSISGNVVGWFGINDVWKEVCGGKLTFEVLKVSMCDCWDDWCDIEDTYTEEDMVPVSGTWSLKYNKSLSKKSTSMLKVVPSYDLQNRDYADED